MRRVFRGGEGLALIKHNSSSDDSLSTYKFLAASVGVVQGVEGVVQPVGATVGAEAVAGVGPEALQQVDAGDGLVEDQQGGLLAPVLFLMLILRWPLLQEARRRELSCGHGGRWRATGKGAGWRWAAGG